ncbi:MAG: efflux RND transporter periplasmic adaptor subunit [Candidatus Cloacimonetes bacterium]|nr:efflux RND transporter periplasmic adaptor subunit [Candidatus Cloacimonadota bacterium]
MLKKSGLTILLLLGNIIGVHSFGGADAPPARVRVANATLDQVSKSQEFTGIVDFSRSSAISSEREALVEEIFLEEGRLVKKGDILVRLNTDLLQVDRQAIEYQIAEVQANLALKEIEVSRQKKLWEEKAVTRQDYDNVYFGAQALKAAESTLRSRLKRTDIELEKSLIRAPADGLILSRNVDVGQWVSLGGTVGRFASLSEVSVEVSLPEAILKFLRERDFVSVSIDALDVSTQAFLQTILPDGDLRSKTFRARFLIPWQDGMLQNMTAKVEIPTSYKSERVLVPRSALVQSPQGPMVYKVVDGAAQPVPVQVLGYYGRNVILDKDVFGESMPTLVIEGNERLSPGRLVEVIQ